MEHELRHYGVLGMRWGVRKDKKSSGYDPYKGMREYDDSDRVIKKGSKMYRISNTKGIKSLDRDHLYVTTNTIDRSTYASGLAAMEKKYELVYKTKNIMISPGYRKRVDAFIEEFDKNPKNVAREIGKHAAKYNSVIEYDPKKKKYTQLSKEKQEELMTKSVLKLTRQQLRERGYVLYADALVSSPMLRKDFINNLKAKGYNMVLDDNDVFKGMAKSPMIVFDPKKNLDWIDESTLTPKAKEKWYEYHENNAYKELDEGDEFYNKVQFTPEPELIVTKNKITRQYKEYDLFKDKYKYKK